MKKESPIQPLGKRILLKRTQKEQVLKGGLIIPDSAKKIENTATVIAIGPDVDEKIKVGDDVLIEKYSSQEVAINDEEFLIIKAENIIALFSYS